MNKYIFICALAMIAMSCGTKEVEQTTIPTAASTADEESILNLTEAQLNQLSIATVSLSSAELPTTIKLTAKTVITPENTVSITHPYGGYVKKIGLLPGQHVTKGQVLVVLEDPQYIQMQEDYLTTLALLEEAVADFNRQKELNANQASSDKVYQEAKALQQTLQVKKRSLEEKLKLMNINPLSVSVKQMHRTISVTAPISGVVSEVFANVGQYISPTNPMMEIINPNDALLNVKLFENDVLHIKVGQSITAYTNAHPDDKIAAKTTAIAKNVNEDGTVDVLARLTDQHQLSENLYYNVELEVERRQANVLPADAVVHYEGKDYVFEALSDMSYQLIPVTVGASQGEYIPILAPALHNKKIVSTGAYQLLTALKNKGE